MCVCVYVAAFKPPAAAAAASLRQRIVLYAHTHDEQKSEHKLTPHAPLLLGRSLARAHAHARATLWSPLLTHVWTTSAHLMRQQQPHHHWHQHLQTSRRRPVLLGRATAPPLLQPRIHPGHKTRAAALRHVWTGGGVMCSVFTRTVRTQQAAKQQQELCVDFLVRAEGWGWGVNQGVCCERLGGSNTTNTRN